MELHIEHREIFVFSGAATLSGRTFESRPSDRAGLVGVERVSCPTCGSPELAVLTDSATNSRLDPAVLNWAMQNGSVHSHRSPSGEWWICTKSFHQC